MEMTVRQVEFADFQSHIGTRFEFADGGEAMAEVLLKDARALTRLAREDAPRVPFSLLFKSASTEVSPQRVYEVRHAVMGDLAIFLVPVAGDADGISYEAVFG